MKKFLLIKLILKKMKMKMKNKNFWKKKIILNYNKVLYVYKNNLFFR